MIRQLTAPRFALWKSLQSAERNMDSFHFQLNSATGLEMVTQDSANAPLFDPMSRQFRHGGMRNLPLPVFQLKLKRALERQ
jgi:hypothetical protein